MGARNIGELVVPCQSDVTVVCPEGGQRGPEGGWLAPWDLSHSTILPILCEGFHNYEVGSSVQETKSTGGVNVESCCPLGHLPLIIASL